jgi:hypothetical protein
MPKRRRTMLIINPLGGMPEIWSTSTHKGLGI